jgi:hypothetical protein
MALAMFSAKGVDHFRDRIGLVDSHRRQRFPEIFTGAWPVLEHLRKEFNLGRPFIFYA